MPRRQPFTLRWLPDALALGAPGLAALLACLLVARPLLRARLRPLGFAAAAFGLTLVSRLGLNVVRGGPDALAAVFDPHGGEGRTEYLPGLAYLHDGVGSFLDRFDSDRRGGADPRRRPSTGPAADHGRARDRHRGRAGGPDDRRRRAGDAALYALARGLADEPTAARPRSSTARESAAVDQRTQGSKEMFDARPDAERRRRLGDAVAIDRGSGGLV